MEEKEMNWLKWRLCYVKNGICAFVDYFHLANGMDWVGTPARNADLPIPTSACHRKYLRFEKEAVNTDLFGIGSPFKEWDQKHVVSQRLPAFEVNGAVVKYGDEFSKVIKIFQRNQVPYGWME